MNINPINLKDLTSINEYRLFKHIDPTTITFKDLMPGYIVKTRFGWRHTPEHNVYIVFDGKQFRKIFDLRCKTHMLVRADLEDYQAAYRDVNNYIETFPKDASSENNDIIDVWKTDIDIREFDTEQSILDFYIKYDLFNI